MFFGPFRSGRVTSPGRPFGSLLIVACGPPASTVAPMPSLSTVFPVPPLAPGKSPSSEESSVEATRSPSSRIGLNESVSVVGALVSSEVVVSAPGVPPPAESFSSGAAATLMPTGESLGERALRPLVPEVSKADCCRTRENSTNEPAATAASAVPTTPGVMSFLCFIPNPFLPNSATRSPERIG